MIMANDYTQLKDKLQLIFWPYLRLVLLFLTVYGLLDWALLILAPAFEPPEELWELGLPLLVGAAAIVALLWPRLRLLSEGRGRFDARVFLALITLAVMTCGAASLHGYLVASQSKMVVLDSPANVDLSQPLGRYYQFRTEHLNPKYRAGAVRINTSDKGKQLNFHLYISTPVLAAPADTLRRMPVWLGVHYSDDISAQASDSEKEAVFQAFLKRSDILFRAEKLENPLGYYARLGNTDERAAYVEAARRTGFAPADTTQALMVLQSGDETFALRGNDSARWLTGWVSIGSVLFFILLMIPNTLSWRVNEFRAGRNRIQGWPEWLTPRAGYFLTPLLLLTNAGAYVAMALATHSGIESFAASDLRAWGGNYGPAVAAGQWWRLLSSAFLHGGLMHLANNLAILGLLGWMLEKSIGTVRFALVYFLAGIGGSLVGLYWHPDTVSVGASGAIFGLLGAALVLALRKALPDDLGGMLVSLVAVMGGLNLLLGFLMPGVDNAAHLGGILAGAAVGLLFSPGLIHRLTYSKSTNPNE